MFDAAFGVLDMMLEPETVRGSANEVRLEPERVLG